MRFCIDRLSVPRANLHKEVYSFVAFVAVHHAGEEDIAWINLNAGLFLRLSRRGGHYGLISIQMSGRDAVFAVPVACVETTEQQDLIPSKEQQMDSDRELGAHKVIINCLSQGFLL